MREKIENTIKKYFSIPEDKLEEVVSFYEFTLEELKDLRGCFVDLPKYLDFCSDPFCIDDREEANTYFDNYERVSINTFRDILERLREVSLFKEIDFQIPLGDFFESLQEDSEENAKDRLRGYSYKSPLGDTQERLEEILISKIDSLLKDFTEPSRGLQVSLGLEC